MQNGVEWHHEEHGWSVLLWIYSIRIVSPTDSVLRLCFAHKATNKQEKQKETNGEIIYLFIYNYSEEEQGAEGAGGPGEAGGAEGAGAGAAVAAAENKRINLNF